MMLPLCHVRSDDELNWDAPGHEPLPLICAELDTSPTCTVLSVCLPHDSFDHRLLLLSPTPSVVRAVELDVVPASSTTGLLLDADGRSVFVSVLHPGSGWKLQRFRLPDGASLAVSPSLHIRGDAISDDMYFTIPYQADGQLRIEPHTIIALDKETLQIQHRFGKGIIDNAMPLAVLGNELIVADEPRGEGPHARFHAFSLDGQHHRTSRLREIWSIQ
jgi:hypothetical protein